MIEVVVPPLLERGHEHIVRAARLADDEHHFHGVVFAPRLAEAAHGPQAQLAFGQFDRAAQEPRVEVDHLAGGRVPRM